MGIRVYRISAGRRNDYWEGLAMSLLGGYEGPHAPRPLPHLRRSDRVRTIHASLAIEGNTLSLDQATTVLEGKRIAAPEKDIHELRNALATYEQLQNFDPASIKSLLAAHRTLMDGLIRSAGKFRTKGVAVARGDQIAHIVPPADRVRGLVKDLLKFANLKTDPVPMLVRAAVVHYELEFIHPFADGNGRIGRLWPTLMLQRYHQAFEFVPFETIVRQRQKEYYAVLGACDAAGDSSEFIDFSLEVTETALEAFMNTLRSTGPTSAAHRLDRARSHFGDQDYLSRFSEVEALVNRRF